MTQLTKCKCGNYLSDCSCVITKMDLRHEPMTENHAKEAMLENMEYSLAEIIADFLDSEEVRISEAIAGVKDPVSREESELHIRMATEAMREYRNTISDKPHQP